MPSWNKHDKRARRRKILSKQRDPQQPCSICGIETMCDAYIRDERVMCRLCAEEYDMRWDAGKHEERWVLPPPKWLEEEESQSSDYRNKKGEDQ